MSLFSQKLAELVTRQGAKLYRVADLCGLDRSNIYKCLRGERLPGSAADVQALGNAMQLTPAEQAALLAVYRISKEGDEAYYRREKINGFLQGFSDLPSLVTEPASAAQEAEICTGESSVNALAFRELEQAKEISLLIQPEYGVFLPLLKMLAAERPDLKVRHVLYLESGNTLYNLNCLRAATELQLAIPNYVAYYFFGNAAQRQDFILPPWLFLTETAALQITSDAKSCVYHRSKEAVQFFQGLFDGAVGQASLLLNPIEEAAQDHAKLYSYGCLTVSVYESSVSFALLRGDGSQRVFALKELSLCADFVDFFHGMELGNE